MKLRFNLALAGALLLGSSIAALAGNVRTDYDHNANFAQYHTYSWGKVKTTDPFYASRIQQAVDSQLQAKGWQLVPSGGSVTIFAFDKVRTSSRSRPCTTDWWRLGRRLGLGRMGLGWPGQSRRLRHHHHHHNQSARRQPGHRPLRGHHQYLSWRGLATQDLATNSNKNTRCSTTTSTTCSRSSPPKPSK